MVLVPKECNALLVDLSLYLLVSIVLGLVLFGLPLLSVAYSSNLFDSSSKVSSFECGLETSTSSTLQVSFELYRVALVYLVFDIETLLVMPYAIATTTLGYSAFLVGFEFLVELLVACIFVFPFLFRVIESSTSR